MTFGCLMKFTACLILFSASLTKPDEGREGDDEDEEEGELETAMNDSTSKGLAIKNKRHRSQRTNKETDEKKPLVALTLQFT